MTHLWFEPATSEKIAFDVYRQPVVRPDRSVRGYAVSVALRAPHLHRGQDHDEALHGAYSEMDLAALVGGEVVFLRATTAMLLGDVPLPPAPWGLVLEIPLDFTAREDSVDHLVRLRKEGVGLALADFTPDGVHDALLPLVDYVKVDLVRGAFFADFAIGRAHASGVAVIAERVDSEADAFFCMSHGVDLLQGPLFFRDPSPVVRPFTAGEIQCLELVALLTADEVDTDRVADVIRSDPGLTIRVLRLVNSSAFGGRYRIGSVQGAVVRLGPPTLVSMALSSLVGAQNHSIAGLWYMLSRAIACRTLAGGDDAAYTVGLLSAVVSHLRIRAADLVARTCVSPEVSCALLDLSGPFGPVLSAVLAHEANDPAGVLASGLDPSNVTGAYLDAVAQALGTAATLAGSRG